MSHSYRIPIGSLVKERTVRPTADNREGVVIHRQGESMYVVSMKQTGHITYLPEGQLELLAVPTAEMEDKIQALHAAFRVTMDSLILREGNKLEPDAVGVRKYLRVKGFVRGF